jgi:hypothetical protein
MSSRIMGRNVSVKMSSVLATVMVISGITNANPAVVSYTGTDPANGDYVWLSEVVGMPLLNDRIVRVANVNAAGNTFELDGLDTTNYGTFASGNGQVVTFGTSFSTVKTVSSSGGDAKFVDVTTIHDADDKEQVVGYTAAKVEMESFEKIGDVALRALESASETSAQKAFLLTFNSGAKMAFVASVGTNGIPSIPTGDAVTLKCTLSLAGRVSKWGT